MITDDIVEATCDNQLGIVISAELAAETMYEQFFQQIISSIASDSLSVEHIAIDIYSDLVEILHSDMCNQIYVMDLSLEKQESFITEEISASPTIGFDSPPAASPSVMKLTESFQNVFEAELSLVPTDSLLLVPTESMIMPEPPASPKPNMASPLVRRSPSLNASPIEEMISANPTPTLTTIVEEPVAPTKVRSKKALRASRRNRKSNAFVDPNAQEEIEEEV